MRNASYSETSIVEKTLLKIGLKGFRLNSIEKLVKLRKILDLELKLNLNAAVHAFRKLRGRTI